MRVNAMLSGLVIVGSHYKQTVNTNLFGATGKLNGMRGVVRAHASNNRSTVSYSFFDDGENSLVLIIGHGRVFSCGATDNQPVMTIVNEVFRQVCNLFFIHRSVLSEGRYHRREQTPKGRVYKSTGVHHVLSHTPQSTILSYSYATLILLLSRKFSLFCGVLRS